MPELPQNKASSPQDPRLSPLHNRLLAENLGRWAHVYYTTPPERREQALTALLDELAASSPESVSKHDNAAAEPRRKENLPAAVAPGAPRPAAPSFEGRPRVPVAAPVSQVRLRYSAVALGCLLVAGVAIFAWRQNSGPATPTEREGAASKVSAAPAPRPTADGVRSGFANHVPPSEKQTVSGRMALPAPKKAAAQSPAVALPAKKTEAALSQATATPSSNAEQVQKLWQDVKQRKPEALVSLATIYARGEGVARDCGQASVLTEAAIRRAPQRAAELRQSLQQAGCE